MLNLKHFAIYIHSAVFQRCTSPKSTFRNQFVIKPVPAKIFLLYFALKDVTSPNATCPEDQIANTQDESNTTATVSFIARCEDNIDEDILPNCTATSNITQFRAGETNVTCSCTDHYNNTEECFFKVIVKGMNL